MSLELVKLSEETIAKLEQELAGKSFDAAKEIVEREFKRVFPSFALKPIVVVDEFDKVLQKNVPTPRLQTLSQMIKGYQSTKTYPTKKAQSNERQEIIWQAKRGNIGSFMYTIARCMNYDPVFTGVSRKGEQINIGLQSAKLETDKYKEWLIKRANEEGTSAVLAEAAKDPVKAQLLLEIARAAEAKGGAGSQVTFREADVLAVMTVE